MSISANAAQRFSEGVLQIYAAESEPEVGEACAAAAAALRDEAGLADLLTRHAEHRRAQLRGNPSGESPALPQLTRREHEVLQYVARGETDAAIGQALGISPKTASKHVENILRKLGVETRTAAAMLFPGRRG